MAILEGHSGPVRALVSGLDESTWSGVYDFFLQQWKQVEEVRKETKKKNVISRFERICDFAFLFVTFLRKCTKVHCGIRSTDDLEMIEHTKTVGKGYDLQD